MNHFFFDFQEILKLDIKTKEYKKLETNCTSHNMLTFGQNGELYCEVGSPTKFPCIVQLNTLSGEVGLFPFISQKSTNKYSVLNKNHNLNLPFALFL